MSKGENNMEYKKSSIFSDKQKIDNRNLCLYLNFKNEKNENILNLLKLIEKDLIEKFEDDFIFDMEFNEEPITNKAKHIAKIAFKNFFNWKPPLI